jgi:hypothetical protein
LEGSGRGLNVLAWNSPGGTEENHENLNQDRQSQGRDLNLEPPEYEAGVLTTGSRRSVSLATYIFPRQTFITSDIFVLASVSFQHLNDTEHFALILYFDAFNEEADGVVMKTQESEDDHLALA